MPKASLADFPFEASGSFTAAFGSSFGAFFAGLADVSPLVSILGGSGGGGGGTDIPLGAAGGSDTCATYSRDSADVQSLFQHIYIQTQDQKVKLVCKRSILQINKLVVDLKSCSRCKKRGPFCSQYRFLPVGSPSRTIRQQKKEDGRGEMLKKQRNLLKNKVTQLKNEVFVHQK